MHHTYQGLASLKTRLALSSSGHISPPTLQLDLTASLTTIKFEVFATKMTEPAEPLLMGVGKPTLTELILRLKGIGPTPPSSVSEGLAPVWCMDQEVSAVSALLDFFRSRRDVLEHEIGIEQTVWTSLVLYVFARRYDWSDCAG